MPKPQSLCIPLILILTLLSPSARADDPKNPPAEPQKSTREQQLQDALKRYPEADLNHDGILSPEEARAYLRKARAGGAPATQPATTPAAANPAAANPRKPNANASRLPKPDFADVSYGSHPNDKFDLWLAKSDQPSVPTPLIVFIHGGGFKAGDKSSANPAALRACLDAGVSFATINYRFRTSASINTVLRDPARAIQFFRFHAADYNLDKSRIATFGGSAGAGASLWLAFHDDLADPKSDDPVSRESTRICAAGAVACQATYDILKWQEVLGGAEEAMRFSPQSEWPAFYGLKSLEDLQSPEGIKLRADADMLGMISKDDPPIWLGSSAQHAGFATKGDVIHNPKHAQAVKKRCDEVGVKCLLQITGDKSAPPEGESEINFLIKTVKAPAISPP